MLRLLGLVAPLAAPVSAMMQRRPEAAGPAGLAEVDAAAEFALQPAVPPSPTPAASASAPRPAKDVVYHLHVPKTAGLSWAANELEILQGHGLKQASREGCYGWQDGNPRVLGTAVLLRSPQKHLVSMYDMCKRMESYGEAVRPAFAPPLPRRFADWVKAWRQLQDKGWQGDLTPLARRVSGRPVEVGVRKARISAWSSPPFSPEQTFLDEKNWTSLDGGGTLWHHTKVPFRCYSPLSFQTQRLSCAKPMEWPAKPNLELALENMRSAWFVGIVEHYQASACLLRSKLGESPLPAFCDCRDQAGWRTFHAQRENDSGHATDITAQSEETMRDVDTLAAADRELYAAGLQRFLREVREAEEAHGTKLLCNATAHS